MRWIVGRNGMSTVADQVPGGPFQMCKRLIAPSVLFFAMTGLQPALAQVSGVHARPLLAPPISADDPPVVFLQAARAASPDSDQAVLDVGAARQALAVHDRLGAERAIDDAIVAVSSPPPVTPIVSAPVVVAGPPSPPPPEPPPVTYALLPGHWQLRGANYVWVPPETTQRRIEERPYVQGRYVWRDGAWVWVPDYYEGN
jgi:hypothetical protein